MFSKKKKKNYNIEVIIFPTQPQFWVKLLHRKSVTNSPKPMTFIIFSHPLNNQDYIKIGITLKWNNFYLSLTYSFYLILQQQHYKVLFLFSKKGESRSNFPPFSQKRVTYMFSFPFPFHAAFKEEQREGELILFLFFVWNLDYFFYLLYFFSFASHCFLLWLASS